MYSITPGLLATTSWSNASGTSNPNFMNTLPAVQEREREKERMYCRDLLSLIVWILTVKCPPVCEFLRGGVGRRIVVKLYHVRKEVLG